MIDWIWVRTFALASPSCIPAAGAAAGRTPRVLVLGEIREVRGEERYEEVGGGIWRVRPPVPAGHAPLVRGLLREELSDQLIPAHLVDAQVEADLLRRLLDCDRLGLLLSR